MSMACGRSHVDVELPVSHELKIKIKEWERHTRGVGFHSGSEKWWGFIIWLGKITSTPEL